MVRQGSLIWLVAVAGCFPQGSTSELDALREEVEALRAEVDSLKEEKADAAALVDGLAGKADATDLDGYATDAELAEGLVGKADASALDGYATDGELADGLAGKADATALADLDARVSALEGLGGGCACDTTGIEGRLVEVERNLGDVQGTPEIELVRVEDLTERVAAVELYLGDDPATPDAVEPFSAIEDGDVAVKDWVGLQGYLTSVPGGPYATMAEVDGAIGAALGEYATVVEMEAGDDAVEAWVTGQGYAVDAVIRGVIAVGDQADRDWVNQQGYLTSVVGGVTLTDVDAAIDAALVGYATEGWVSQLGFATTTYVDAGDAAERTWVEERGYVSESEVLLNYPNRAELGDLGLLSAYVRVDPIGNDVRFVGANVHIESGTGRTDDNGIVTGFGNLIVGYDEGDVENKSGSHNIIVGMNHEYSSYGGLIAGFANQVQGPASFVVGYENIASGDFSAAVGGRRNSSAGMATVVSGGYGNTAVSSLPAEYYSSVFGGHVSSASGYLSVVLGGSGNQAINAYDVVVGGFQNSIEFGDGDGYRVNIDGTNF
jgi:hypothetical protein